jgi:hypothetical protein
VILHPEAKEELDALPEREIAAIENAIAKLRVDGDDLGFPYSSAVRGAPQLRELRPRRGRSPWRAFYARVQTTIFVVAAVGPEAQNNPRAFRKAVELALERLETFEVPDEV